MDTTASTHEVEPAAPAGRFDTSALAPGRTLKLALGDGVKGEMTLSADTHKLTEAERARDPAGRFAAGLGLHALLDGVSDVARLAAEDAGVAPASVSKGAWDRARLAAGRDDLPTAEGVRKRLDRKWPDVLEVALGPPANRLRRLGVLAGRAVFTGDEDTILRAIRWAAQQVGRSPRPGEYDLAIEEWNRRTSHDQHRPTLPVSESILERMTCPRRSAAPACHHFAQPATRWPTRWLS